MGKSPSIVALLLVLIFIVSAFPVSAIDRLDGQFWTYNASMQVSGLNATGTVMYSLSGQGSVNTGGKSYDADILTISGNLHASSTLFGVPYSASATLGGKVYEVRGEMSTIREDLLELTNISTGSTPTQLLARIRTETVTTYAPAFLTKFDPTTTGPGDTWTEVLSLSTTVIVNGTTQDSISRLMTYSVVIAPSMEEVSVDAGTFQVLKVTVTDNAGARGVYWWSSKVQNFVVEKMYDASSSQPNKILTLVEFDTSARDGTLVAIMVGVVVIAVAAVILAVILNARRKREPTPPLREEPGGRKTSQMPQRASPGAKAPGLIEKQPKHR